MAKDKFTLPQNEATAPYKLKKTDAIALDFENLDKKGLKDVLARFKKKKMPVKDVEGTNKARRANGMLQKQVTLVFEDGQKLTIFVKADGTIFQVKLNNKAIPLRNTTDLNKAIDEMVGALAKNADAYQRSKVLREQRAQKQAIKPKIPKVKTNYDTKIAEVRQTATGLEQQVADLEADLAQTNSTIAGLREQVVQQEQGLAREREETTSLENQIAELEKAGYTLPGEKN